jgi:hypothetical protein
MLLVSVESIFIKGKFKKEGFIFIFEEYGSYDLTIMLLVSVESIFIKVKFKKEGFIFIFEEYGSYDLTIMLLVSVESIFIKVKLKKEGFIFIFEEYGSYDLTIAYLRLNSAGRWFTFKIGRWRSTKPIVSSSRSYGVNFSPGSWLSIFFSQFCCFSAPLLYTRSFDFYRHPFVLILFLHIVKMQRKFLFYFYF